MLQCLRGLCFGLGTLGACGHGPALPHTALCLGAQPMQVVDLTHPFDRNLDQVASVD